MPPTEVPDTMTEVVQPFDEAPKTFISNGRLVHLNKEQQVTLQRLRENPGLLRQAVLDPKLMTQFHELFSYFYHVIRTGVTINEKNQGMCHHILPIF